VCQARRCSDELLYNSTRSASPIKPLIVPCNFSPSSDKSSVKSNSGRYGINDTSSSSSDESSVNSGLYSDIEEIPAPTPSSSKQIASQNPSSTSSNTASFLKRLLPPSHSPGAPRRDFLPSLSEIVENPFAHVSMFFSSFGPESVPPSPNGCSHSRLAPIPDLERSVSPLAFAGSEFLQVGFDASQHDIYEISDHVASKSRSNSPMDLASPSPSREVIAPTSIELPPLLTPPVSTKELNVLDPAPHGSTSLDSSENNDATSVNAIKDNKDNGGDDRGGDVDAVSAIPNDTILPETASTSAQMKKFEELLEKLQFDVSKLHNHRRKYKARFNSNVEVISGKLAQFDDRLAEVNAEYTMLFDQVDTIHHVDIPDLQTQLGGLQQRMDELPDFISSPDPREYTPQYGLYEGEDVEAKMALQLLVDEMKVLRETSQVQMAAELEAIKVMRETAMANIAEAQAQAAAIETPVLLSLKRKRDDTDENEAVDESENSDDVEGSVGLANQDKDMVMDEDVFVPSTNPEVLAAGTGALQQVDAPPRKRARRIASVLAHTATAVTIGAVVTWSALAFS